MKIRSALLLAGALLIPGTVRDGMSGQTKPTPLSAEERTRQPTVREGASGQALPAPLPAEDRARQLVVMIRSKIGAEGAFGSGIIFGAASRRIYIVTANHVVREGPADASLVEVQFSWLPHEWKRATLLDPKDTSLDVAVLNLEVTSQLALPRLDYAFLGSPESVKRNDDVHYIGFPNQRPWDSSIRPDPVSEVASDAIRFRSAFVQRGHSGGALLDRDRGLIGLIRADQNPEGVAVRIDRVIDLLREWKLPVQWTRAGAGPPPAFPPSSGAKTETPSTRIPLTNIQTTSQNSLAVADGELYVWGDGRSALPGRFFNGPVYDLMHIPNPFGRPEARIRLYGGRGQHACLLDPEGQAYCWGSNEHQQLGSNTSSRMAARYEIRPSPRNSNLRFQALSLGSAHACGVSSGTVYCWGDNRNGQLGDRTELKSSGEPVPIALPEKPDNILAGGHFACAGNRDRNVIYCWGGNHYGELGQSPGRPPYSRRPVVLPVGEFNFRTLSLGSTSGCILDAAGYPFCWGQITGSHVPRAIRRSAPLIGLTVGRLHACGATKEGEAWCWGDNSLGQIGSPGVSQNAELAFQVTGGIPFRFLRAGRDHTCGVSRSNEVYCWGDNRAGAVGPGASAAVVYSPTLVKLPIAPATAR